MTVMTIIHGRSRDIGFMVRRLLPAASRQAVGPFVFLDHMGPATFPAGSTEGDVRPHPHIGLATVTYLCSGAFDHRDSLGNLQRIEPGAVNVMSAGHGVAHSERIPADIRAAAHPVEGIQMWLALPRAQEQGEPGFVHYPQAVLPLISQNGSRLRVLIGTVNEQHSPVQVPSPTLFADLQFLAAAHVHLAAEYQERALYVAQGSVRVAGTVISAGELAVLPEYADFTVSSDAAARCLLLGGAPLDGPRFLWWNFVASDKALIETAKAQWQARTFAQVPGEQEFIPLPER
ncbi:pirin family protein [Permianibacter sp. IMCC34836]|uniref:pirin family protein n=1 Tax=Permianibacter fluminis TaxID=2738515 RepID=UPI001557435F|nr:pirin family protein [Permianibacter fluminis]NQD36695.1 pirin family protein [Permianibacter fluminis]